MADGPRTRAWTIAAVYFFGAAAYVLVSSVLVYRAVGPDNGSYLGYELAKGIAFVALSSLLIYTLLRRQLGALAREIDRQVDTQNALRRSRDQLARAQQVARLGSWEADLVDGVVRWSDEVYRLFGVDPDDFEHTIAGFYARVHPEDREALERAQQQALADQQPLEMEHRIVRPDGEVRHVLARAEVRTDSTGRPVLLTGTVQDTTERKQVELELDERNRQQAAIARLGMEALGEIDAWTFMDRAMAAAARTLDVELTGVLELLPESQSLRLVTGIGWPPKDLGHVQVGAGHGSQAGFTLDLNEPVVVEDLRSETRFRAPQALLDHGVISGVTTVIHGTGRPWGVLGVHATRRRTFTEADVAFVQAVANLIGEVLQRERDAGAVREHDILRQLASEAASLGGWALDPDSGEMTWSEEVARIHEVSPDYRPSAETVLELFAPEHREHLRRCLTGCTGEGAPFDEELQLITARGRRIWVRVIGRAERDPQGRVVRVHGAIQDISERKSLESMLHQAQRLEAVGQLTGGIAHDFNNLLTVILGNCDQLVRAAGDDADLRNLAATSRRAALRGAELTARLLAYARKQPLAPRPTDVNALLTGMLQLLRRSLGEQVLIEMAPGADLWSAMVDPAQLESAVLNLCLNARDAMPEGGRLTLETRNVHLDQADAEHPGDISPGDYVVIRVTDTGHGMTPELTERVFEPFFTTKSVGQGSGLGLSMVYGFAKQSRGHVKVDSEPERGTTMTLYLPRTIEQVLAPAGTPGPSPPRGHGQRILVVEDDDLVREFVAGQVASLGYEVLTAANGTDAMAVLEARDDVNLLFTDVVMPGAMDGRQLAEAAKALHPHLPVLFTSGYTEDAIVHQGRLDPDVELLNKPYRLADLARKIDATLHPSAAG